MGVTLASPTLALLVDKGLLPLAWPFAFHLPRRPKAHSGHGAGYSVLDALAPALSLAMALVLLRLAALFLRGARETQPRAARKQFLSVPMRVLRTMSRESLTPSERFAFIRDDVKQTRGPRRAPPRFLRQKTIGDKGMVLIDVNNVRGRIGFAKVDLWAVCASAATWAKAQGVDGKVIAAVDHGPRPAAFAHGGVAVSFAGGKGATADDVIVRDVEELAAAGHAPIVVVTSDRLLRQRCRRAFHQGARLLHGEHLVFSRRNDIALVDSPAFAGALDDVRGATPPEPWEATRPLARPRGGRRAPRREGAQAVGAQETTDDREMLAEALFTSLSRAHPEVASPNSSPLCSAAGHHLSGRAARRLSPGRVAPSDRHHGTMTLDSYAQWASSWQASTALEAARP